MAPLWEFLAFMGGFSFLLLLPLIILDVLDRI